MTIVQRFNIMLICVVGVSILIAILDLHKFFNFITNLAEFALGFTTAAIVMVYDEYSRTKNKN